MNSYVPVPTTISDHIFKLIDGLNIGVIYYGLILEAYLYEIQLDTDQELFDQLLNIPNKIGLEHPL
jgi:hypothetical protein